MKAFIAIKVAGSILLTSLKLTLSQICFKNFSKITSLYFRKWLINSTSNQQLKQQLLKLLSKSERYYNCFRSFYYLVDYILGNAVINGNKKLELWWISDWIRCQFPAFILALQTVSALTIILSAHAILTDNLLN